MNKKIKAVKIDVIKNEVYEIEIEDKLESYYEALECSLIERVVIGDLHDLIVDEEGLCHEPIGVFQLEGNYYSGHGLLVGHDGCGNWISHALDINKLSQCVAFPKLSQKSVF
jgi:hypothetical protein